MLFAFATSAIDLPASNSVFSSASVIPKALAASASGEGRPVGPAMAPEDDSADSALTIPSASSVPSCDASVVLSADATTAGVLFRAT